MSQCQMDWISFPFLPAIMIPYFISHISFIILRNFTLYVHKPTYTSIKFVCISVITLLVYQADFITILLQEIEL
jgi:hypothetical protein